jgi:4-carboxymuconolactone decarboxylase
MRLPVCAAAVLVLLGVAQAQAPATRDLNLRGDRFKPLTYDQLTPAQKTLVEHLYAGERGGMNGPFNVLLRSPEMGDQAQKLGAQLRFHSSLNARQRELAIIMTARAWTAQYEWYAHSRSALQAGISKATVDAIAAGRRPSNLPADEQVVFNFCDELIRTHEVSDAAFHAAIEKLGERGVVDVTALVGYYHLVSMLLNIDRYPLPDNEAPPLRPISN